LVDIVPARYGDVVYIARNMRKLDAEEILPLTWSRKPEDLAAGVCASNGIANVALSSGRPVAAWGATMTRPQMWTVWMFSTDRWPDVALTVTRNIRRVMMPSMIESGAVRADCWSMDGHDTAHRWLEVLGALRECSIEDYGATRKTFHCYSWTRSRLERDGDFSHVRRSVSSQNANPTSTATATASPANQRRPSNKCRGNGEKKTYFGAEGTEFDHLVWAIR